MIIKINGKSCTCEKNELLINIARRNGIFIPTLCNHASVEEGRACCRLCIVEITDRGRKTVEVSCIYPVTHEIEVETNSPKIQRERGVILSLLADRAPDSPEIKALSETYGAPKIGRLKNSNNDETCSNSNEAKDSINVQGFTKPDDEKCIMCGLCVEACRSLSVGAISTINRGITKAVSTPYGDVSTACIGCGACAKICPTEAISLVQTNDILTIWGKTFKLIHCERCGAVIGTKEQIDEARKRAGDLNATDSEYLCDTCRKEKMAETLAATYGYLDL